MYETGMLYALVPVPNIVPISIVPLISTCSPANSNRVKREARQSQLRSDASRLDEADSMMPTPIEPTPKADSVAKWPVAKRRQSGLAGTLLSDLTPQYLANISGTLQLLLAIIIVECMTGSKSSGNLYSLDLEIDKTLNRIRKSKNISVGHSSDSFNSISEFDTFENKPDIADNPLYELEPMENHNRTLKELATLDVLY
ncbi:hypothetical protein CR513_25969, partial [Mucuna pruriens]